MTEEEEEEMSKLEKVQLAIKQKEVQTILKHVKGERPLYRLIPRASFSTTNSVDEQPDFPMSNKAFIFRSFIINPEARKRIKDFDNLFIRFYEKKAQPRHLLWSTTKFVDVRACGSE